jgi:hypothetical protein
MLDHLEHKVEGLSLPKGGNVRHQTFVANTALYFKGSQNNLDKTQTVLELFCRAFGARINWKKSVAI